MTRRSRIATPRQQSQCRPRFPQPSVPTASRDHDSLDLGIGDSPALGDAITCDTEVNLELFERRRDEAERGELVEQFG